MLSLLFLSSMLFISPSTLDHQSSSVLSAASVDLPIQSAIMKRLINRIGCESLRVGVLEKWSGIFADPVIEVAWNHLVYSPNFVGSFSIKFKRLRSVWLLLERQVEQFELLAEFNCSVPIQPMSPLERALANLQQQTFSGEPSAANLH